ncbi:hypothetical protein [Methylobacter sp.]|nr:hypothetical protein [Methylobacter sp.]MDI1277585.1 hypothetical protein [Methylobacter sp.]
MDTCFFADSQVKLDYSTYLHPRHRPSQYYIAKDGVYAASLPGAGAA